MKHKFELININGISDSQYKFIKSKLSIQDKKKSKRLSSKRNKHFLAGRLLLDFAGIDVSSIYYIGRKPVVDGICFSMSHCDDLTAVIVNDKPIGIDIERIKPVDESMKKILNLDSKLSNEDFIKEFTKRESYIKLKGLGMKNLDDDISNYKFITEKVNDYYITISLSK